jgi:hemolysin type calcium-binding protein
MGRRLVFWSLVTGAIVGFGPASAWAAVSCSATGSGLPGAGKVVTVTMTEAAGEESVGSVKRSANELLVLESGYKPVTCSGGPLTVTNTDTVNFIAARGPSDQAGGYVDLSGGALAPGATPEAEGSSEIEFSAQLAGKSTFAGAFGSEGPDRIALGTQGQYPAINLNSNVPGDGDADLTVIVATFIPVSGEGGDDFFSANGGPGFGAPLFRTVQFYGGRGDDLLIGGNGRDVIQGGRGADRLYGLGRHDELFGGRGGRNRLYGGSGSDYLNSRGGGKPDRDHCGGGRNDIALYDPQDSVSSCERSAQRGGPSPRHR